MAEKRPENRKTADGGTLREGREKWAEGERNVAQNKATFHPLYVAPRGSKPSLGDRSLFAQMQQSDPSDSKSPKRLPPRGSRVEVVVPDHFKPFEHSFDVGTKPTSAASANPSRGPKADGHARSQRVRSILSIPEDGLGFRVRDLIRANTPGTISNQVPMVGGVRWKGHDYMPIADAIATVAKVAGISTTDVGIQISKAQAGRSRDYEGSERLELERGAWSNPHQVHQPWQHRLDDPHVIWSEGLGRLNDALQSSLLKGVGVKPDSSAGRFYRGFSGAVTDMIFDPISMATSTIEFAHSPKHAVEQVWHGISRLWATHNPDGSPVTPEQRGEGLAALGAVVLPVLSKVPRGANAVTTRIAVIRRLHELGFQDMKVREFAEWAESERGARYMNAFEKGRRKGSDGKPMNTPDPKSGVKFKNGYPVFPAKKVVKIEPRFNYPKDARAANTAAGIAETPKDHVWHHHERFSRMELVDEALHKGTSHTGGMSLWKHRVK